MDASLYAEMYQYSLEKPDEFWAEQAEKYITWSAPWTSVSNGSFEKNNLLVKWFENAKLNASFNCLDRHLEERGDKTALIWEGDELSETRTFTYRELHREVSKFANVLKARGVSKGDRIAIYLPLIAETAIAMLACTRIGAVHTVIFGGFSAHALANRLLDADCKLLITADQSIRGGHSTPLKNIADIAMQSCPNIHTCMVVRRGGYHVNWNDQRDVWYDEALSVASDQCPIVEMDSEDPLFILYTSGATGQPKGVVHTTGGYLLQTAMTQDLVFDTQESDVHWCTADIGWITGHSYVIYGPLLNGGTTLMFEGKPSYPTTSRYWDIVDKHQVNIFYTSPSTLRSLMSAGDDPLKYSSRKSLRILASAGEPITPELWHWYHDAVGEGHCYVVDTWFQTETGTHMMAPLSNLDAAKPGAAMTPFFGIEAVLLDDEGNEVHGNPASGNLVIKHPWPSMLRTIFGHQQRFTSSYFSRFPNYYYTGDGARRDKDGDYWITGRTDDVLNISGLRLASAEVEASLMLHDKVQETAVVGVPDSITGEGIYAYVILEDENSETNDLKNELANLVRKQIGPVAKLNRVQWTKRLPRTRSGKVMRRILRTIACDQCEGFGDTSTMLDSTVITELLSEHKSLVSGDEGQ